VSTRTYSTAALDERFSKAVSRFKPLRRSLDHGYVLSYDPYVDNFQFVVSVNRQAVLRTNCLADAILLLTDEGIIDP
jgi:hypothetical protein